MWRELQSLPDLATGGKRRPGASRIRGFTLIEILVVIVIIGVMLAVAQLSFGVLGRDTEVEDQTRRLYAILTQAREEAELQGRDLGVLIEQDGYLFMRYDHPTRSWRLLDNDAMFVHHELPEGVRFRLWLDAREVILKSHADNEDALASVSSESSSASSAAPPGPVSAQPSGLRPQISILSSGDLVPFELRVSRDDHPFYWRLLGGADNSLNIEPGGER